MSCHNRGFVLCVAGPSGAGKTTIISSLNIKRVITATTRLPRESEVNGLDYHFITDEMFHSYIEAGKFFEYQQVHGKFYGTLKGSIEQSIAERQISCVVLDVNGAINLKTAYPDDVVTVFITCSSKETLKERIKARGADDSEVERRMLTAESEMLIYQSNVAKFDYFVLNSDLRASCEFMSGILLHESAKKCSIKMNFD